MRVDFRFPGTPLVVEVLGYFTGIGGAARSSPRDPLERLHALVRAGLQPLQYTYDHVARARLGATGPSSRRRC